MKSMTAFGRAAGTSGGKNYVCEVKSVNNRYLDVTVKLPRNYSFLEERVTALVKERGISRGKVDVFIGIEAAESRGVTVALDTLYADSYIAALRELKEKYSLPGKITLELAARGDGMFIASKPEEDAEADWQGLLPYLNSALDGFEQSRTAEGERLKADLAAKKENLRSIVAAVKEKSALNAKGYRAALEEKLRKALDEVGVTFSSDRILTEVAIYVDKTAVDEEIVRLYSHFKAYDDALNSAEPVGRRLDFLVQEMNREVNTTGSKACDAEIAALVVSAKCELEKIREQIQNIE